MKPIFLFAGPSLPARPPAFGPAMRVMPPARSGDLIHALRHEPAAIALVDGIFEMAPTVGHKEILAVIDHGVPVYGAASLGALRASELDRHGMIGVGRIYEACRDGLIESDAAVMVAHAPAELGYRPLTLALVDVEAILLSVELEQAALNRDHIRSVRADRSRSTGERPSTSLRANGSHLTLDALDPGELKILRAIARRMNFRARTWEAIFEEFAARTSAARMAHVARVTAAAAFSQKERDTAMLIERLGTGSEEPQASNGVPHTVYLERLLNACVAQAPPAPGRA